MTDITMVFMELLRKHELDIDSDFLREGVQIMMQKLIELEAEQQIGAGRYERKPERVTYRNGYRRRLWETRVGEVPLRIPKLREGVYFPSLLEPRKRSEQALLAVIQEAYVKGVSTRKVDDLVQALSLSGMDKSKVSRITKGLDPACVEVCPTGARIFGDMNDKESPISAFLRDNRVMVLKPEQGNAPTCFYIGIDREVS